MQVPFANLYHCPTCPEFCDAASRAVTQVLSEFSCAL